VGQIFGPILGPIGYFFELIITYPIFNVLMLLDHLFGDFALSIIVMTLLIRLVLYPLTLQQLKSSKATQAIQPQMAEIRRKYAKDPRAQQEAISALYKESGVNPLAGCLPLLIQLPVLYGLFYALNTVLRNPAIYKPNGVAIINKIIYPFLPHFAKLPDFNLNWFTFINPAFHISLGAPDPTHILPIVAGLMTFVQLRMSQPKTSSNSKDMMTQQMQMMQFLMPAITIFIGWNLPAGLAVYWTTTSLFSAVQQYFVTGWGSLFNAINLSSILGGGSSTTNTSNSRQGVSRDKSGSYSGDQRKESQLLSKADEPEGESDTSDGPVGRNLRTTTHANGSSSSRRRPRGASSSARRRGNASNRSRH
jgi:YidC/Oxa1 family membrane protein insertase